VVAAVVVAAVVVAVVAAVSLKWILRSGSR
jgi:hypothetical protein